MNYTAKFFFLCSAAAFFASCSGENTVKETEFYVRGNCGMCEDRIEEVVKNVPGVKSADYTVKSEMLKVAFDTTTVKENDLHKALATAGHETKLEATDEATNEALPECCRKGFKH